MSPLKHPVEPPGRLPAGARDRFPGHDTLARVGDWDAVTAGVVLARLGPQPPLRFFTDEQQAVGERLFDLLLDQNAEPRVPVLRMVDARLAEQRTDGWRYEDMPEDGEAFRRSFAALDEDARERYGAAFPGLADPDAAAVVGGVQDLGGEPWHGLNAAHVWSLWTRYACTAFYSHPWAWNEIGFGGPAYPTGYASLGVGGRETWEVRERGGALP